MPVTGTIPLSSAQLWRMAEHAQGPAAHLRPLVEAIPCGVPLLVVTRGVPFQSPRQILSGPAVAVVGDDLDEALGPEAFHLPGLRKLLRAASATAVMSGAARPSVYAAAPGMALITRRPVVLVETQEQREAEWLELVRKLAPRASTLIVTPYPVGHA
jgi:hypothetical protein